MQLDKETAIQAIREGKSVIFGCRIEIPKETTLAEAGETGIVRGVNIKLNPDGCIISNTIVIPGRETADSSTLSTQCERSTEDRPFRNILQEQVIQWPEDSTYGFSVRQTLGIIEAIDALREYLEQV